jgi:RNA polymerase sigma factor (sigma-70 family)
MDRDAISQADDRDRLRRALLTLPQRQRAVVVLRHYDDLSEADVAAQLGCSVGTVKSQSARGLARLREVLDGDQTTMRTPVQIGAQA